MAERSDPPPHHLCSYTISALTPPHSGAGPFSFSGALSVILPAASLEERNIRAPDGYAGALDPACGVGLAYLCLGCLPPNQADHSDQEGSNDHEGFGFESLAKAFLGRR